MTERLYGDGYGSDRRINTLKLLRETFSPTETNEVKLGLWLSYCREDRLGSPMRVCRFDETVRKEKRMTDHSVRGLF